MVVIIICALLAVGFFVLGLSIGIHITRESAAVKWFTEHEAAERARRASVEEVRAAWRERQARERRRFHEREPELAPIPEGDRLH